MTNTRRIDVKTGFQCNNRCRFCVQGDKRRRHPDRTTEEVLGLLEDGRAHASEVVLTGGEVTIRPDLPDIVRHARSLGYSVIQIQTNGRMLSSLPYLESLVRAGATEVSPALHGPNPEVHDLLTRSPGSFRQTVKGIRNARRLGIPVIMNSVITRLNHALLAEMALLFVSLGVDQFQLAFVHALGSAAADFDDIVPRLSHARPFVLEALGIGDRARVRCMTEAIPLCFLPGVEDHAAEFVIPRTRIYDAGRVVEDYTEFRLSEGKAKGPVCAACACRDVCEGPWREYPERFGWEEFSPLSRRPAG
jgi:cyclic pyranopterin phosphate synthase